MKLEESTSYVKKCFNGEPASCSYACPFRLDIRSFMEKVEKGRWLAAFKLLSNAVIFPVIVSALCPQPCREHCQRTSVGDESLALSDLEAACIRYTKSRKPDNFVIPPKSQRIAVVGAGPAGLSCAVNLAQKKFHVTVFEKDEAWGGKLREDARWEAFDEDIALRFSVVDVDFQFNKNITSMDELNEYDAVYIATGNGGTDFGLRESWNPELMTTHESKIFMGGALCGMPVMEAIAQGVTVSMTIETFLQTGKASKMNDDFDRSKCERYLKHDDAESMPLVIPASPDGYTQEEAKAEATRCFKCDCDYCERSCEMLQWFRKKPHKIGIEVYTDANANPPMSSRTLTREAYSCNICGKCKEVCPVDVDMGALLQFSREDRVNAGKNIPALHDYWLREFDFHSTESFFAAPPKGKTTCEYAFFPGCQLGAAEPEHVLKSYEYLCEKADTGIIFGCCGAPAYWAGDKTRLTDNAAHIRKVWEELGSPTLVFACAYCENVFSLFLPEIKRISLYEILAKDESLKPARYFDTAVVFDPCAARDDAGMQSGVRALALSAGVALEELKEPNRCCGYGGHIHLASPGLYAEIVTHRTEASDKPYIVYCANCQDVFRQTGKSSTHILDMVFDLAPDKRMPHLHTRWENSLEVKKQMVNNLTGKAFALPSHEWDAMKLVVSDLLFEEMDRNLIIEDDLKEAIWQAEKTGNKFVDEEDGVSQCSLVKSALTYWVQYKEKAPETYEVLSAYSHRMSFIRED